VSTAAENQANSASTGVAPEEPAAFFSGRRWKAAGWALLLAYGVLLGVYFTPIAGGSDSSGYLNFADLLLRGKLIDDARPVVGIRTGSSFATAPLGFSLEQETGRLIPTYPSGVPLHLAAAELVVGRVPGMYVVGVGGALAAVVLCFAVGRELGLSKALAALSAAMLAWNPVFLFIAIQPLSDVLATAWCLAAIYGVLRARRSPRWALLGGAAAAMAVLVRPTNVLIFPALLVWMPGWRALAWFVAGGLPGAAWMMGYQNAIYGSPLSSGYGDLWSLFRASNLGPTVRHYGEWLPRFVPILWILGALLLLPWARTRWRMIAGLALWFFPVAVFYVFYDVTKETWWCLRFLLPCLPALILGGALGIEAVRGRLSRRGTRIWTWSVAGLAVWAALLAWNGSRGLGVFGTADSEPPYREIATWVNNHVPKNAAVVSMIASGAVHYYTDCAVLRWDMIEREEFQAFAANADLEVQPVYALLFREEEQQAMNERLPGRWERIFENRRGAVWRMVGPMAE